MAGYSVTYSVVDDATAKITAINKQIAALRAPIERQQKAMMQFVNVSGLQKVADGFKGIAGAAAEAFSSLARLVPVIGGLTGAATVGGIAALIRSFTDLGTALERDADYLNTSTDNLQQWQNAVKLAGGSVGDLTESMKGLARTAADAFTGRNVEALAAFNQAGIALKDTNGHLRNTTELLPQVLDHLDGLSNAQDRETRAVQLGGKALYELDEDFRRSGKSRQQWMQDARGYGAILDPDELRRYRQAVGELDVAFSGLSTEITGVLATALAPLIKEFATWVHTHQPEIIEGVRKIGDGFRWVGTHMDTIKTLAEVIAGIFATKWAIGIVSAIANVTASLVTMSATLASLAKGLAGSSLLRYLGPVGAFIATMWPSATNQGEVGVPPVGDQTDVSNLSPDQARQVLQTGHDISPAMRQKLEQRSRGLSVSPATAGQKTSWTPPADTGTAGPATAEDPRGMIPIIRAAAIANNVDPDTAVAVAKHEGLRDFLGDSGKSGSAFQLFTGGGLGNEFQKQTGLDPLDPANEKQAIWWAMQNVNKTGWEPYHGAARAGVGNWQGIGAGAPALPGGGAILPSPAAAGVRPQLTAAMSDAFKAVLPQGYTAKLTSGVRDNNPNSQHFTGNAEDWQIFDPQGRPVSNRGADTSGLYRAAAVAGLANLMKTNPELAKQFAWGGHFETEAGSGVADLMHYDLGGPRGRFGDPLGERADAARLAALGMPEAEGAPAQVTGGAPVKGAVDVTVTHRNPPPDVGITATATGSVNLNGPRTEQQQFANP